MCRALVALEDGPDHLLSGGVVSGNLQELVRSMRLLAPQFVDRGLAVRPAEERTDDVGVDDARQRVALFGEAPDVVAQGLTGLLLAALEVPRVARVHVHALKVADKDLAKVCPAADGVGGQEIQPGADVFSQAYGEILDDEAFIGRSSGSACKPVLLQPHAGVRIPSVLHDIRR